MMWPWQHTADLRERNAKACHQAEEAQYEYERTALKALRVSSVLSFLFHHADNFTDTRDL